MKPTLREQLDEMLETLTQRQNSLNKNVNDYAKVGNWGDAAINQIKHDTIQMVVNKLKNILN